MSLKTPQPTPIANRIESLCSAHGETWADDYAWLRAENWEDVLNDPANLPTPAADYLRAENTYYDLAPLHNELASEIRARMEAKRESVPARDGPYKYSFRLVENAEHRIRVRTDLNGDSEEVIFDVNKQAIGFDYFDVRQIEHSPNHETLIWTCDDKGADFYTLHIRNIASGLDYDDVIENVDWATWGDDQTIFYTRLNSACRATQVYRHVVGGNPEHDVLVYEEHDERFDCDVYTSLSREFVWINISTDGQREFRFIPTNDLTATPILVEARKEGAVYTLVSDQGGRFIIETKADGAEDWKLVETPINACSKENWTELVAHQPGRMIVDVVVFKDWIIWLETVDALPQIAYFDKNGSVKRIQFEEQAYSLGIFTQLDWHAQSLIFEYSSPTTPRETYEFNLQTEQRALHSRQEIPSGHNPEDYVTRRFNVASHDGAEVPVTLLYRHDTPIDGTAPAFLCGYGANGDSIAARFGTARLSLVDRGFVYIIAHVRGGEEKGSAWYDGAKLENNSFHDFIAVADALIDQRYCAADKIVSFGGSSGGMLVAASMNMRPDLFAGVIAAVPNVGVLNRLLDDTLPGTPVKWAQWGNPIASKVAFESIRSYSPYENTKAVAYPPLHVTAAVSDSQVMYWEPAKWVARIRSLKMDNNVVLFRTDMKSGHGGKSGRFAQIDETAREYAFALAVATDDAANV